MGYDVLIWKSTPNREGETEIARDTGMTTQTRVNEGCFSVELVCRSQLP